MYIEEFGKDVFRYLLGGAADLESINISLHSAGYFFSGNTCPPYWIIFYTSAILDYNLNLRHIELEFKPTPYWIII